MGIVDAAGFDELLGAAEEGSAVAVQRIIGLFTTKHTGFFRTPRHFEIAAMRALSAAREGRQARFWSAAAATGEEPYSLAMALVEAFGSEDPPATILATDIDVEALACAQRGEYGEASLKALAPARRERFLRQTDDGRRWRIDCAPRRLVEFCAVNLAGAVWAVEGPFDVIFCRNALMYLEASRRQAALERMASLLAPDGLLILDPAEHVGAAGGLFCLEPDGLYTLRRERRPEAFSLTGSCS